MKEKPCAALVSSVISPIMAFRTPVLPFSRPARDRLMTTAGKLRESPKESIDRARPDIPINTTGLRPILSESLLHCKTQRAWAKKKVDSCPGSIRDTGVKAQEERPHYYAGIVASPIFVALCNSCLVYQSKYERENNGGGDWFAELYKQDEDC